jgi:DNA-binding NarL/FixJ family response regulator
MHVFQLLGAGLSTREIAADLNRSFKTVESHRENIKRKLQLRGAAELVNGAIEWALEPISLSAPVRIRTPKPMEAAILP